jgi:hypothetical protein
MAITNWKTKIDASLSRNKEDWNDIEAIDISLSHIVDDYALETFIRNVTVDQIKEMAIGEKFCLEFEDGHGTSSCPIQFQIWTKNNFYFSYEYDGSDLVISKPRNPPDFKGYNPDMFYVKEKRNLV